VSEFLLPVAVVQCQVCGSPRGDHPTLPAHSGAVRPI